MSPCSLHNRCCTLYLEKYSNTMQYSIVYSSLFSPQWRRGMSVGWKDGCQRMPSHVTTQTTLHPWTAQLWRREETTTNTLSYRRLGNFCVKNISSVNFLSCLIFVSRAHQQKLNATTLQGTEGRIISYVWTTFTFVHASSHLLKTVE